MFKQVTVSGATQGVLKRHWKRSIGTGRLGLALQQEYQEHLEMVQEAIGFDYIRGHGLLHDDVGIYRELTQDGETRVFYNFTYIDRIFDAYLAKGLKPYVELGFMPEALASGDQTVFYWKGNVTPPKDYDRWAALIEAVIRHFIERYGLKEVLTWPFEVWNEPNLVNFWKDADQAEYFKLYQVTAEAVKRVHPELQVGGPAICGGSDHWITDFLEFCHARNVPVDFVSRHAYTARQPHRKTPEYYYQELANPEKMLHELQEVREMIRQSPFPDLPFHITEYNTSYSPINPVHDTALNAAYLARILSESGDYADVMSYWTFSDVFEESDVPKAQFHGGFGLIALNGIPKPTFHLFAFFQALGEEVLYRDDSLLVTRREDGTLALLSWNAVLEEGEEGDEQHIQAKLPFSTEEVFVKRQIVNEAYANPWKTWQQMGRPRFPSKGQIQTLRQAAVPKLTTQAARTADGVLELNWKMGKNEITLLEVAPVRNESHTYWGLDDSLIYRGGTEEEDQ
ncbi:xylan 1,4-beta-xylosidase [Xylanibacillus composti]|uniref:Beta-xylosidase n=1 Tax=Xylanibacillus composti TaxID=1572762 RepID=A0A8J4H3J7_9BACL|nr:xylan 1,4-beta-xylosidase [Xylanibacillus composti]MDT9727098.1 xylan 1,4-beta-xylosidase [Xylanibacillus composti]GIQ68891.1 beta-xylosidase [Xylanibacillus composti]